MQRILFSCAALIATLSPIAGAVRLDATVGLEALLEGGWEDEIVDTVGDAAGKAISKATKGRKFKFA